MKFQKRILIPVLIMHSALANSETLFAKCPKDLSNASFREMIISEFDITAGLAKPGDANGIKLNGCLDNKYQTADWTLQLSCYQQGRAIASNQLTGNNLREVIQKAYQATKAQVLDLNKCQFKFDFSYFPDRHYAFIDYKNHALELAGNRVAVRKVSVDMIKQQIKDSIGYLRSVQNPQLNGFYKFYDAGKDRHEQILRTIYSSSSLYTYMLADNIFPDLNLSKHFKPIAKFILSQQIKEGPEKGAFYYSIALKTQKPKKRIVVGTASKTIFTLLELNKYYPNDNTYLQSAIAAGNWLVKQVADDGRVSPYKKFKNGQWLASDKQSLLYSGQVLSALSRLYLVVYDKSYSDRSAKIANGFLQIIKDRGPLLGDDYRPANLISTSWVLRSLMDYYQLLVATQGANQAGSQKYLQAIQLLANKIKQLQIKNLQDISYVGKFSDSMTTSGNGWLNEVFGDYYKFCNQYKLADCKSILNASILSTRYLMQNAYRENNTYNIPNPKAANGSFSLKYSTHMVRTDAVCHGVNSFLYLLNNIPDKKEVLLDIPEQPIQTLLPLIRAGNKKVAVAEDVN